MKIEKIVLDLPYFKSLRGRNEIANKRGKKPGIPGFINNRSKNEIEVRFTGAKGIEINIQSKALFEQVQSGLYKQFYIPALEEPEKNNVYVSKLIGKIAIEALAKRIINVEGWNEQFVNNVSLDQLRDYVRFGKGYEIWPYHQRKIYSERELFKSGEFEESYEILHEYDFLFPEKPIVNNDIYSISNLYFVCAIMGIEYSINITNAGLEKYFDWLQKNNDKSILKMKKHEFNIFK